MDPSDPMWQVSPINPLSPTCPYGIYQQSSGSAPAGGGGGSDLPLVICMGVLLIVAIGLFAFEYFRNR